MRVSPVDFSLAAHSVVSQVLAQSSASDFLFTLSEKSLTCSSPINLRRQLRRLMSVLHGRPCHETCLLSPALTFRLWRKSSTSSTFCYALDFSHFLFILQMDHTQPQLLESYCYSVSFALYNGMSASRRQYVTRTFFHWRIELVSLVYRLYPEHLVEF